MDQIADLLTRIRNANLRQKDRVDVPHAKLKLEIVRILKEEGFIANFKTLFTNGNKRGTIRVFLKFSPEKESVIRGITARLQAGLEDLSFLSRDSSGPRRFRRDHPFDPAGSHHGQAGEGKEGRRRDSLPGLVR